MTLELVLFQVFSALLFSIGLFGVLARRNAVLVLISIEILLNAVNVNLIGLAAFLDLPPEQRVTGQVIAIFVIIIAAAEIALGLAIVLRYFRIRDSANTDAMNLMKG